MAETTKKPPKKSGLGRGYESIFGENTVEQENGSRMLRLGEIEPRTAQPRKTFDSEALASLANSIKENGLIQPVVVRQRESGFYELIAGERRWRAAKLAGLSEIPAIIMDVSEQKTAELALIENVQREDLNPVEVAIAFRSLMEDYQMTQETVARTVGRSRSAVANSLRLLELPEEILALLSEGSLSEGHAKVLLSLKNRSPETLMAAAGEILERQLSVRETEALIKRLNRKEEMEELPEEETEALPKIDYTALLEQKVTERLGRAVKISEKGKKKRLELSYEDTEDLEALLIQLCGKDIFADF